MDEKELESENSQEILETSENTENLQVLNQPVKKKDFHVEGTVYTFLAIFGIVFMSCLLIFQILLSPILVIGRSMQPTINISVLSDTDDEHCDYVYYAKSKSYQNDDIVIVSNEEQVYVADKDVEFFIKRVIACPGQTITFFLTDSTTSGFLTTYYYDFVVKDENGNIVSLDDSYETEEMCFTSTMVMYTSSTWFRTIFSNLANSSLPDEERIYSLTLNDNQYFVMGDNRNESEDSRYFGAVSYDYIAGDVKIHIPYGKTIFYGIWQYIKSIF